MAEENINYEKSLPAQAGPSVFEADLKRIETQINKFKELPEAESMSPQEIVKKSVKQMSPSPEELQRPIPARPENPPQEAEKTVEYLVNVAATDGIVKANQAAKDMDPYVLDSFHDAMVGKFYPELQRRGIID